MRDTVRTLEAKDRLCGALGLDPNQVRALSVYIGPTTDPVLVTIELYPDREQVVAIASALTEAQVQVSLR